MADDPHRGSTPGGEGSPRPDRAGDQVSTTSRWSRILRLAMGWFLVGLGVVGLFLPVLQGVLLLSLGLLVLSRESPALRRLGRRLGDRFPVLRRLHDRIRRRGRPGEPGEPGGHDPGSRGPEGSGDSGG